MIDVKQYWNDRYSNGHTSGNGSYGEELVKKIDFIKNLNINSISEIGCGDLNFAKSLLIYYPGVPYVGQDISEVVIDRNKGVTPQIRVTTDINKLPKGDLLLCMDVLFHITDDKEYEQMLETIKKKWTNYLAITAYEYDNDLGNHVNIRKFDPSVFGKPLVREVVEEDGQKYFYLFKRDSSVFETGPIDLSKVSCCLITKESVYPKEIEDEIMKHNWGEVLVLVNSDSPYNKHRLFAAAKNELIYYQDDDAICPIDELSENSNPDMINVVMKPGHFEAYKNTRMTMGLGWGSIFPKSMLQSLIKYANVYGYDDIYKRETERIFTYLNYPQNRLSLEVKDLSSAMADDRLWRQPEHNKNIEIVEERCAKLI